MELEQILQPFVPLAQDYSTTMARLQRNTIHSSLEKKSFVPTVMHLHVPLY